MHNRNAEHNVYRYYITQSISPTHGSFQTGADLENHCRLRASVLSQKLHLQPRLFRGAHVVEFGPDTGENALAFAVWGAEVTLVEPNLRAHSYIRDYFSRFGLAGSLRRLEQAEVHTFRTRDSVDFVVAEGFLETLQPQFSWLPAFARVLRPGGMAVISYTDAPAALFELGLVKY